MGASAVLESVYIWAFAINVKTIAPIPKLYQFGHAIWWYTAPTIIKTFLEAYDFSGKIVVPFATSGGSGLGKTAETLQEVVPAATVKAGKILNGRIAASELKQWADGFE